MSVRSVPASGDDRVPGLPAGADTVSVDLECDLYGKKVPYHGVIEGFDGGTGAAFAIIPAQNATGNWIKVVQRLPVRIRLNADELAAHPLRVGLSMKAKVDLRSDSPPQQLARSGS